METTCIISNKSYATASVARTPRGYAIRILFDGGGMIESQEFFDTEQEAKLVLYYIMLDIAGDYPESGTVH